MKNGALLAQASIWAPCWLMIALGVPAGETQGAGVNSGARRRGANVDFRAWHTVFVEGCSRPIG